MAADVKQCPNQTEKCVSEYQDRTYGKRNRVFNSDANSKGMACTICGFDLKKGGK